MPLGKQNINNNAANDFHNFIVLNNDNAVINANIEIPFNPDEDEFVAEPLNGNGFEDIDVEEHVHAIHINNVDNQAVINPGDEFIEEHVHVLEDQFIWAGNKKKLKFKYGIDNDYIKPDGLKEEDCMYRIAFSKDRRHIYIVRCPKAFKGTKEELLDRLMQGISGFTEVDHMPSKDGILKNAKLKKALKSKVIKELVPIDDHVYVKETSKHYTLVSDIYEPLDNAHNNPEINLDFINSIHLKNGVCAKNVYIYYRDFKKQYIKGFTTGNIINNCIEMIGSRYTANSVYNLSVGKFYETALKKYNPHYSMVSHIKGKFPFVKIRIKSFEESSKLFGFKSIKSEMVGKVFDYNECKVDYNYKSPKLQEIIKVVNISVENNKKSLKFLLSDVEFLYIDSSKIGINKEKANRVIRQGDACKIIDDRKIDLRRGDTVRVMQVFPNKNSRSSVVRVIDPKNQVHSVFLKQLKRIVYLENENSIKKSIAGKKVYDFIQKQD